MTAMAAPMPTAAPITSPPLGPIWPPPPGQPAGAVAPVQRRRERDANAAIPNLRLARERAWGSHVDGETSRGNFKSTSVQHGALPGVGQSGRCPLSQIIGRMAEISTLKRARQGICWTASPDTAARCELEQECTLEAPIYTATTDERRSQPLRCGPRRWPIPGCADWDCSRSEWGIRDSPIGLRTIAAAR